jgi:hypothetical protein
MNKYVLFNKDEREDKGLSRNLVEYKQKNNLDGCLIIVKLVGFKYIILVTNTFHWGAMCLQSIDTLDFKKIYI